jgi:hypothetical protein
MPRPAQARAWWADVEDVRERIERKRERERQARGPVRLIADGKAVAALPASKRGVREVRPGSHLLAVPVAGRQRAPGARAAVGVPARRRARRGAMQRIGPHPDRAAAWAVVLGFALVLAAILSAHG